MRYYIICLYSFFVLVTSVFADIYHTAIGNPITSALNNTESFMYNPGAFDSSYNTIYLEFKTFWKLQNLGVTLNPWNILNLGLYLKSDKEYYIGVQKKFFRYISAGFTFVYKNNKIFPIIGTKFLCKEFEFLPFNKYYDFNLVYNFNENNNSFGAGIDFILVKKTIIGYIEFRNENKKNVVSTGISFYLFERKLNIMVGYDILKNFGVGAGFEFKNLKFIYSYNDKKHYGGLEIRIKDLTKPIYRGTRYRKKRINTYRGKLNSANELIKERKYFEALKILRKIRKTRRNKKVINNLIQKCVDEVKVYADKIYKRGVRFYFNGEYRNAKKEFENYLLIYPSNKDAINYIKKCNQKIKLLEQLR